MTQPIRSLLQIVQQGDNMESELANNAMSAGQAGVAGVAAAGKTAAAMGAGLVSAAVIVMIFTQPRDRKEWATALICTVISSLCGGSALIQYLHLQEWATEFFGVFAIGGVFFLCGLPGWALVRWIFNYITKNRDKGIDDVVSDIRSHV
jgi:hypothetical protein